MDIPQRLVNYNGDILSAEKLVFGIENRAFKYGDSLFETFRVFDGRMPFLPLHYERLQAGLTILGYVIPENFDASFLATETQKLINNKGNHRVRLMVFRSGGGLYTPISNHFEYLIETISLEESRFHFPKKGLQVGLCSPPLLFPTPLSSLKTGNSLPYILAAQERKKNGWDDILIQNHKGQVVEAMSSNLIWIKNGQLHIPAFHSGTVAGIMLRIIQEQLDIDIFESTISPPELPLVEGILLCNAIQGIRWVAIYGDIHFHSPNWGQILTDKINKVIDH